MKIKFNLTTEDWVELQKNFYRNSKGYKKTKSATSIGILVLLAIMLLINVLGMKDFNLHSVIVYIIVPSVVLISLVLIIILFSNKIDLLFTTKIFKTGDNSAYLGMHEIELKDEYLIEKASGYEVKIFWEKIIGYSENEQYIFIYTSSVQGLVIPKFKIKATQDSGGVYNFIREKLENKIENLV